MRKLTSLVNYHTQGNTMQADLRQGKILQRPKNAREAVPTER